MKPARFDYARPETLHAALALLAEHGSDAAILAGGQSLVPMLNLRVARPDLLVDINRVPDLDGITVTADRLVIGARTRHADVLRSDAVRREAPLLTEALYHVAHAAVRNRGTLGGSLALADPAAEIPACILCLGGELVAASRHGERRIAAETFFHGMYSTALEPDELLLRVEIPRRQSAWRHAFAEVARRHGDYALAGLALLARLDGSRIMEARLGLCGAEPAPRRFPGVEAAMLGDPLDPVLRARAAAGLREALEPIEGGECPAAYRRQVAGVLLERALDRIAAQEVQHAHA